MASLGNYMHVVHIKIHIFIKESDGAGCLKMDETRDCHIKLSKPGLDKSSFVSHGILYSCVKPYLYIDI